MSRNRGGSLGRWLFLQPYCIPCRRPARWVPHRPLPSAGFSLPELLLVLLLSAGLAALILQALSAESRAAQRLGRLLRERQLGLRALELVRQELLVAQASSVELRWDPGCSLAGRRVVLQLQTTAGVITYSQGPAPSAIWHGAVLMRCGPAYGLAGELSGGQPQNRVLLDGLPADAGGLALIPGGSPGVLQLQLGRQLQGAPALQLELPVLAPFEL